MKITKAVIPAAGLGTRMLPIARSVPKEVLPIVDKPAISYLVEEAANSGITDILIITGRNKDVMEDYFDYSPEYEFKLNSSGKTDQIKSLREICDKVNIMFMRQKETKGLGHAILRSRSFTGDEPFAVLYGDDIIASQTPVCQQLIDAYEKYGKGVCGIKEVDPALVYKYCSLDAKNIGGNLYDVADMIEKPKPEQVITNFAILGRLVLVPEIYDILENTPLGAGNELQLTDAMQVLAKKNGMIGVDFEGKRYDMGSKLGFMMANVEHAINHPEIGDDFRKYIKEFAKSI